MEWDWFMDCSCSTLSPATAEQVLLLVAYVFNGVCDSVTSFVAMHYYEKTTMAIVTKLTE